MDAITFSTRSMAFMDTRLAAGKCMSVSAASTPGILVVVEVNSFFTCDPKPAEMLKPFCEYLCPAKTPE